MEAPPTYDLDWREGLALRFLDGLLGRGVAALREPVELGEVREALLRAGAARMARAAVRWMVEEGGWRERAVLRGGRRARGRAWDAHLGEGFAPRFTEFSRSLWIDGAAVLPALAGRAGGRADAALRRARRRLPELRAARATDSGDWIVASLAWGAVPSLSLAPVDAEMLRDVLRRASPLVAVMAPAGEGVSSEGVDALLRGPTVRLVECAEDRIARAWRDAAAAAWSGGADAASRWRALAATMRVWCERCDAAERCDLLRPAARAVAAAHDAHFGGGAEAVRRALSTTSGLRSVVDRDALLAAVGGFVDVGLQILRARDRLAAERYGDPRYEEAQVSLRVIDEVLGSARRGLAGVAAALRGEVG